MPLMDRSAEVLSTKVRLTSRRIEYENLLLGSNY